MYEFNELLTLLRPSGTSRDSVGQSEAQFIRTRTRGRLLRSTGQDVERQGVELPGGVRVYACRHVKGISTAWMAQTQEGFWTIESVEELSDPSMRRVRVLRLERALKEPVVIV